MFCAYKVMSYNADLVTVLLNSVFTIYWILISSAELMLMARSVNRWLNQ